MMNAVQIIAAAYHAGGAPATRLGASPRNPRGATRNPHGCIYCYARLTHEYLGLSAGLDFETRIFVMPRAPELLRADLSWRSRKPWLLAMSGVTLRRALRDAVIILHLADVRFPLEWADYHSCRWAVSFSRLRYSPLLATRADRGARILT